MIYRPSVPDNVNHWQVFDTDAQIKDFLECTHSFAQLYFEGSEDSCKEFCPDPSINLDLNFIQLKGSKILKGLVTLERFFTHNDVFTGKKAPDDDGKGSCERINLGDESNPKMVIVGKCSSSKENRMLNKLLEEYIDVFAWSYDDLKEFRNGQFQHQIPLKLGVSPFRQKLRNFNPLMAHTIFKEVDKMLKARIIYLIHHITWVTNIVPVKKKNREIRICVDFHNLNQASLKDNYALPNMDHILQIVAGLEMMLMLDGFSGYNQVSVAKNEQHKTSFITPWGKFAYNQMPFGLINAGATFQRAMDSSFRDFSDRIIVVYLDDLTVFSKDRKNHLKDLRAVLQCCREHGISLNPKKSFFYVTDGNLLGHIVSKEGVKIDPDRVNAIQHLSLPSNQTGVRSFFGQVNFLRRFVPKFAKTTKHIISLLSERYSTLR